jgi:hypothetical protein
VGWTDGLSGIEWIFQREDFGPDVTTAALGLLESVVAGESGHHVRVSGNEDPEGFTWDLRSGVYQSDRFHSVLGFEIFECRAKKSESARRGGAGPREPWGFGSNGAVMERVP